METTPLRLERVVWIDSGLNFAHEWHSQAEIDHRIKDWNGHSVTVGYVVYEGEDRIALAQSLDAEKTNFSNVFLIYEPCIVSREELE